MPARRPFRSSQYTEMVRQQRPRQGWLTKEALAKALSGMVVTERVLSQVGPAVSSANSMLIYGKPGDGKTFLIESLQNLESAPIFVPYAIECQGNIVQVFDPIYHRLESSDESALYQRGLARIALRPPLGEMPAPVHRQRRRTHAGHAGPALQPQRPRSTRRRSSSRPTTAST